VAAESTPSRLPPETLNQLLAPIALYPDALVALILPASTVPSDLVLAARFLSSNGDPAQIANQPWDDSVKSLARYPDIVKWMDQNLEWTTQVGDAFLNQPADVMNTIQELRAQAIAAGTLVDSPQQRIVKEESCIRIVPAEPDVIYVPQYDPEVIYAQPYEPYLGPALSFGIGFAVGPWLNYDCDWPSRKVCVGDWNPRWRDDWDPGWKGNWKRNRWGEYAVVSINANSARAWQPSARIQRQRWQRQLGSDAPSVSGESSRSKQLGSGRSKAKDSSQKFKGGRSKSSDSEKTKQSFSKTNKHSQSTRIKGPKGGSQNSRASYSKPNKSQSAGASGKGSKGGGHKSSKKGNGNKGDKGKK
jgi:hypothetical protein